MTCTPRTGGLQPPAVRGIASLGLPPSSGVWGASMNPLLTEVSTMTITSPLHSFFRNLNRTRSRVPSHPEALQERHLTLPRRIDDQASAASTARALLCNRREDVTLVLYMDDRHRFVGHAVVAVGWVQASRLSARPVVLGATASQATGCVLVRYGRYRALHATEAEGSPPSVPSLTQRPVTGLLSWTTWWWSRENTARRHSPVVPSIQGLLTTSHARRLHFPRTG